MAGKRFWEKSFSRPCGSKISLRFRDKSVFAFYAEIPDGGQKWRENDFLGKSLIHSADTLWVKNFVEIVLSHSVSEINTFLHFTQKLKIAAKSGGEIDFWEKSSVHSPYTLWVKNFVEITLSRSVSEIKAFLHFTQKFKIAAKSGGKTTFGKSV